MSELKTADGQILKQVGVMAGRTEDGNFLPSQPIYIIVSENEVNSDTGMLPQEERTTCDLVKVIAGKMKEYVDICKSKGIEPGL
jgi:hypothetical protein